MKECYRICSALFLLIVIVLGYNLSKNTEGLNEGTDTLTTAKCDLASSVTECDMLVDESKVKRCLWNPPEITKGKYCKEHL